MTLKYTTVLHYAARKYTVGLSLFLLLADFYRASYASAVLGVVILSVCPSVRPSVTSVLRD